MNVKNKIYVGVVSAALLSFITQWEGTVTKPYRDIVGVLTVCSGITENIENREYSPVECRELTKKEIAKYGTAFLECVNVEIPESIYYAGTSMTYNVGVKGACGSRFVKLVNQNNFVGACNAIAFGEHGEPVWSSAGGQFRQGLFNRRIAERQLCLDGLKPR